SFDTIGRCGAAALAGEVLARLRRVSAFRRSFERAASSGLGIRIEDITVAGDRIGEEDDVHGTVLSERAAIDGVLNVGAALTVSRHMAGDGVLNGVAVGQSLSGLIGC